MSYRGRVRNGVVEFEAGAAPPEGVWVTVNVSTEDATTEPAQPPALAELLKRFSGAAGEGLPSDLADNHDHYLYGSPKR